MKKKISILICLLVCCFSFAFVGCSAFDENDKTLLNNAYNKMNEFVDDQAQTNTELLNKIDELTEELAKAGDDTELLNKIDELTEELAKAGDDTELLNKIDELTEELAKAGDDTELLNKIDELTNEIAKAGDDTELLNKIDELTNEIANLKEEKEYSQEEIKAMISNYLLNAMNNSENFLMNVSQTVYKNGKAEQDVTYKTAHVYVEETNTFKSLSQDSEGSGYYIENIYNKETKTFEKTYYDLETGEEYIADDGLAIVMADTSYALYNICFSCYNFIFENNANIENYISYEANILDDNKIELKFSSYYYDSNENNYVNVGKLIFKNGKIIYIEQEQSAVSVDGYIKTLYSINIEYITDLSMEDYLIDVE